MIGILARTRTNAVALAVLAALVGALFVALPRAAAIEFVACAPVGNGDTEVVNYLAVGDSCTIDHDTDWTVSSAGIVELAADVSAADGDVEGIKATSAGSVTVTDPGDTDATTDDVRHKFVVVTAPSIEIAFNDSDNVVKAGTRLSVTLTGKGLGLQEALSVTLSAPSTGLFFVTAAGPPITTAQVATASLAAGDSELADESATATFGDLTATYLSTAGAAPGEYEITASWAAQASSNLTRAGSTTATLTIGDPGTGIDGATIKLDKDQKDTVKVGTPVGLVLSATNSFGKPANPGDVDQVLIYATGADIEIGGRTTGDGTGENYASADETIDFDSDSDVTEDELGATIKFTVVSGDPGTIDVRATVLGGAAGDAQSETFTLTFVGDPDEIAVGEASNNLGQKNGEITFEVTASDKNGNVAALGPNQVTTVIKDADGNPAKNITAGDDQKMDTKGTEATDDDSPIATHVVVTVESLAAGATPGEYTIEVTLNNDATTTQTASFTVVGGSASVDVSVDEAMVAVGDIVTVTATVTDADGNAVVDPDTGKTNVEFSSAGALKLAGFGADDNGVVNKPTKSGMAEAKFVVTDGSGTAVILVNSGTATGTTSVHTAAEEPEAMPEEEASVSCLSNLNAFSTWTCGVDSSASEVFAMLEGRGVTAIHLHNGSAWVRYSVVEGNTVPGSSDFMVTEDDILYISN